MIDWTEEDTENSPYRPACSKPGWWVQKKVLNLWLAPAVDPKLLTTYDSYYPPLHFPEPELGKWNLRDIWVLELRRVHSQRHGYCYSKRVLLYRHGKLQQPAPSALLRRVALCMEAGLPHRITIRR